MPEIKQFGSVLTDIGREKLAKAAHDNVNLDIKRFAVGDGGGSYYKPTKDMTELVGLKYIGDITSYEISEDDAAQLIIRCVVPNDIGHFTIREWGLIDDDGDLVAVANISEIEIAPFSLGSIIYIDLNIHVQFDSADLDVINIVVRPTEEEVLKEDIIKLVENKLSSFNGVEAISQSEIIEILDMDFDFTDTVVIGEAMSPEDVDLFLDDDPDNDPDYSSDSRVGALSDEEIDEILKD